mgnify:FL=1
MTWCVHLRSLYEGYWQTHKSSDYCTINTVRTLLISISLCFLLQPNVCLTDIPCSLTDALEPMVVRSAIILLVKFINSFTLKWKKDRIYHWIWYNTHLMFLSIYSAHESFNFSPWLSELNILIEKNMWVNGYLDRWKKLNVLSSWVA